MKKQNLIFYGWFIVAAGLIIKAVAYGSRYSFSVIFVSLIQEFHWPRDITAAMLSVHILCYGLVAPVAGYLVDRIGSRKTMSFGVILLALGLVLSRWGTHPWHFYITFGVLAGAGLCITGSMPLTIIVKNWFEKKRGLVLSIIFFGSGLAHVWYPAIAALVTTFGWQNTFLIEGLIVAATLLPLTALFMRYHPREKGLLPDGVLKPEEVLPSPDVNTLQNMNHNGETADWTLPKAIKNGRFWMLWLTMFSVNGVMQHILVAHHIAFAVDVGYSQTFASAALSLYGIFFCAGCLFASLSDRIGRESMITIGTVIGISSIIVLMLIGDTSQPWMLYYYASAFGLSMGLAMPTTAAAITDVLRGDRVGAAIGFIWFGFAAGGTIGPWLGGWIFELTGNYVPAFIVAITFFVIGCSSVWLAAPRRLDSIIPGKSFSYQHIKRPQLTSQLGQC